MRTLLLGVALLIGMSVESFAAEGCPIQKPFGPSLEKAARLSPVGSRITSNDDFYPGPATCTASGAWILAKNGEKGCVLDGAQGLSFHPVGSLVLTRYQGKGIGNIRCQAGGGWKRS